MEPEDREALVVQLETLKAALDEANFDGDRTPEYVASLERQIAETERELAG